jgi:hypothetical protein
MTPVAFSLKQVSVSIVNLRHREVTISRIMCSILPGNNGQIEYRNVWLVFIQQPLLDQRFLLSPQAS